MRLRNSKSVSAVLLLGILMPVQQSAAQDKRPRPIYKLADIGTFGGRASYVNPAWELGAPNQMSRHGATVAQQPHRFPLP
jgi:hypothetical protein